MLLDKLIVLGNVELLGHRLLAGDGVLNGEGLRVVPREHVGQVLGGALAGA